MAKEKSNKKVLILLLVFSTCLAAIGQLLFKFGVTGQISLAYFIPGLAAYAISTVIYFVVLSRSHLSWSYGLNGISYVMAVIFALIFLNETIPLLRWVGVVVIAIGAALIGLS